MAESDGGSPSPPTHWFEPIAEHLGSAYLRYSFTKGTRQEVDALTAMLDLGPELRILDVGCGPGRHSLEFARRGHHVVGVDISQAFIDLAKRSAADEGLKPNTTFVRGDARRLAELDLGTFDLVISLCQGAFGLSGGPAGESWKATDSDQPVELDEPILSAMAGAVVGGGRLAVSAFSAYFQLRHTTTDGPNGAPSDDLPAETFDAEAGVNHEWTTVLDPAHHARTTELWTTCYTPRELRLLARVVGLRIEGLYGVTPGDYGPHPPDVDRPEFLLVASRRQEKHS